MERTARRLAGASRLLLIASLGAYVISLLLPAITRQHALFGSWESETFIGGELVIIGLRVALGIPTSPAFADSGTTHALLLGLNLIPLGALLAPYLSRRRLLFVGPALLALGCAAAWSLVPSSEAELAEAVEVWMVLPGYHIWIGSLAGAAVALTLQWKSRVMLDNVWSKRPGLRTAGWALERDRLVHLPRAAQTLCHGAHALRRTLCHDPNDEQATRETWEWRRRLQELSEVDRAALDDRGVRWRDVDRAIERLWGHAAQESPTLLVELDDALDHFIATATAPPKFTAFR